MCHLGRGCISGRHHCCAESAQELNQTWGKGQTQSWGIVWDQKYLWLKIVVSVYKICTTHKPPGYESIARNGIPYWITSSPWSIILRQWLFLSPSPLDFHRCFQSLNSTFLLFAVFKALWNTQISKSPKAPPNPFERKGSTNIAGKGAQLVQIQTKSQAVSVSLH